MAGLCRPWRAPAASRSWVVRWVPLPGRSAVGTTTLTLTEPRRARAASSVSRSSHGQTPPHHRTTDHPAGTPSTEPMSFAGSASETPNGQSIRGTSIRPARQADHHAACSSPATRIASAREATSGRRAPAVRRRRENSGVEGLEESSARSGVTPSTTSSCLPRNARGGRHHGGARSASAHRHGGFVTTGGPCPSGCEDPAAADSTTS